MTNKLNYKLWTADRGCTRTGWSRITLSFICHKTFYVARLNTFPRSGRTQVIFEERDCEDGSGPGSSQIAGFVVTGTLDFQRVTSILT